MKDYIESVSCTLFDAQFPTAALFLNFIKSCLYAAIFLSNLVIYIITFITPTSVLIPIFYSAAAIVVTHISIKYRYLGTQKIYFDSKHLIIEKKWLIFSSKQKFEHRFINQLTLIDKEFWNFLTGKTVVPYGRFARLQIDEYPISLYFYPYEELYDFIESYWINFLKNKEVQIKKAA